VTTFAGSGERGFRDGAGEDARFNFPRGIAYDQVGRRLLVADCNNQRIRAVTLDGVTRTLAGTGRAGSINGPVATATFNGPSGILAAPDGTIFVSESSMIRRISKPAPDGTINVSTFAGGSERGDLDGKGPDARFDRVQNMALAPNGALVVADYVNNRVCKIDRCGSVTTLDYVSKPSDVAVRIIDAVNGDIRPTPRVMTCYRIRR
jgi:DNA-binding beta-propeller fold protein YncE